MSASQGSLAAGVTWLRDVDVPIPEGLCQCGCGGVTTIATETVPKWKQAKGRPKRFMYLHGNRKHGYRREDRGHKTSCWIWQSRKNSDGYGIWRQYGKDFSAHRVSYEMFVGSIPEGTEIDHLCRVRLCVNPDHLEPVTHTENMRRGARQTTTPYQRMSAEMMACTTSLSRRQRADILGTSMAWIDQMRQRVETEGGTWQPGC